MSRRGAQPSAGPGPDATTAQRTEPTPGADADLTAGAVAGSTALGDGAPTLDSSELRVIHTLAQTGSLTRAAEALGLSQPAVSQRIKRVETRLGVPIIERSGRGIRLTQAGEILARHGLRVVREIDLALDKIQDLRGGRMGELRLVGFPSASATIVPEVMRLLPEEAEGVTLVYREAEPPEAVQLLSAGEVDAAIVFDYARTTKVPAGTVLKPLWLETLSIVVPSDHVDETDVAPLNLGDYAADAWIAGCEKCRGNLMTAAAEHGFHPAIIQETDNMPATVAMVAAGGAVALVPGLALASMRGVPDGAVVRPLDPPRTRTVGVAVMDTPTPSPQTVLIERLLHRIDPHKWGLEPIH